MSATVISDKVGKSSRDSVNKWLKKVLQKNLIGRYQKNGTQKKCFE